MKLTGNARPLIIRCINSFLLTPRLYLRRENLLQRHRISPLRVRQHNNGGIANNTWPICSLAQFTISRTGKQGRYIRVWCCLQQNRAIIRLEQILPRDKRSKPEPNAIAQRHFGNGRRNASNTDALSSKHLLARSHRADFCPVSAHFIELRQILFIFRRRYQINLIARVLKLR